MILYSDNMCIGRQQHVGGPGHQLSAEEGQSVCTQDVLALVSNTLYKQNWHEGPWDCLRNHFDVFNLRILIACMCTHPYIDLPTLFLTYSCDLTLAGDLPLAGCAGRAAPRPPASPPRIPFR